MEYLNPTLGLPLSTPGLVIIIIVSRAQQLVVNSGDTVRLPCQVDRLQVRLVGSLVPVHFLFSQGFVMMWKKQSDILTVSDQIVDKVRGKTLDPF